MTYTVAQVRKKLPELIRRAEAGEPVIITKRGIPVVEIVRKSGEYTRKRVFGVLGERKIIVDPDWAKPQADVDAWIAGNV